MKNKKLFHAIYISIISVLLITMIVFAVLFGIEKYDNTSYYSSKCNSYAIQNTNLSKGQIIFIGDSITDLYPLDDYYSDLNLATYNRGIGGDTTKGVLDRLQVSLFDLNPSKIVLMIGTNDINGITSEKRILSNYEEILSEIKDNLPATEVYCMSIIPQNLDLESYTLINVENTTEDILEINPKIKSLAESFGYTFVDIFSSLADENNMLIKEYSDDGIHLNSAGFQVWTTIIKPYLQ